MAKKATSKPMGSLQEEPSDDINLESDITLLPRPTVEDQIQHIGVPPLDVSLEQVLLEMDDSTIVKKTTNTVSKEQVHEVINRLAQLKQVSFKSMAKAVVALIRRGAANAGAPDSMSVDIICPDTQTQTELLKYEISTILGSVTDQKNVRKLAETMAPEILSASLQLIKINPLLDLKGDLANRINRKLSLRKEPSLTREEEICCCTYGQWMPNLNELANSNRLKSLLEEDLNARKKKLSGKTQKNPKTVDSKIQDNKTNKTSRKK